MISVQDTGPGIPKDYYEKIFEKFGVVEAMQVGARRSTGLGLTFCKLAVEAHGGGPILVVYPEGTWYMGMTADRIPRFVQEHLAEGRPVEEWIFARNALPNATA